MIDTSTSPDDPDEVAGASQAGPPPTPRWVKALAAITLTILVIVVVGLLAGGDHGPGRHLPAGDVPNGTRHDPPNRTSHDRAEP